ncbi:hypothetical protein DFH11DRAFT_1659775 [Phellopilus nigrolimitatus]|nr:hypothetical protein DFH11DRAFT_1659775 [Phellopilus nigrolimitatus]
MCAVREAGPPEPLPRVRGTRPVPLPFGRVRNWLEDRRERVRQITEELSGIKEKYAELLEKRKELWGEDARLTNTVGYARNELRQHERDLGSMMDNVCVSHEIVIF